MKNKLNILLALAIASVTFGMSNAQGKETKRENAPILQRIIENKSTYTEFFTQPFANPSMRFKQYDHTLNEISVGADMRNESTPLTIQEGDGHRFGLIDVKAFISRDNYSLWGRANYNNGKQKNMKWNETSDFMLLYPYTMGDSIGGDSKIEQYFFNGGYAGKAGRFVWGLDASYKAHLSYRQVDPRPRNITGELDFTIGGALSEIGDYRMGIFANAYKYKQKNDVEFYNEQGNVTLYHFTGLGMDYYRFRGEKRLTYYKGNRFGVGFNMIPENRNGFTANLSFNRFRFEKIISSLNQLPMSEVKDYTTKAEIGYKTLNGNSAWGVKGEMQYEHRKGYENIFGDPSNNIYPQIGQNQQFGNNTQIYKVSGFYEKTLNSGLRFDVTPNISFFTNDMKYIYPQRELSSDRLNSGISLNICQQFGKFLLRFNGEVEYSAALDSKLELTKISEENVLEPLYNNYRFIASDNTLIGVGAICNYEINNKISCFISAKWNHGWYTDNINSDKALITAGVTF